MLEERFAVLPASLQGLDFLIGQFDDEEEVDFTKWKDKITDVATETISLEGGLLSTLQQHYSTDLV